jgi:hypothetical protein
MKLLQWIHKPETSPSEEALVARETAQELLEKADEIYYERRYLLGRNHFAERIRLIYGGRP